MKKYFFALFAICISGIHAYACTSLLAGKAATADGSTMITYNADSYVLYGELYMQPAADYPAGTMVDVYEWDTQKYLGQIEQVEHTYATVGNMNEHQLAIAESTWSSRPELLDTTAIVDYGSLIYLTLQRARTAREAIEVMTGLVERYGYRSTGESFSIADPNEIWVLEMVSKGMKEKGAVWVAIRIPDDCISGHANQSRIHQIPFSDKENCMYSEDVVSFAREMGYFEGDDSEFSFSNAYAESDYLSYRGCDGRVWAYFNRFASGMSRYLPFVMEMKGETLPLYVKPERKISVRDMQAMMRDHYENTPLAMTADEGAGPWESPYRYSPLMWKVDSTEYFHERPIATQQTGFSFVAQMRDWLPDAVGGVCWFSMDNPGQSPRVPIFCGTTDLPAIYKICGNHRYREDSALWHYRRANKLATVRWGNARGIMEANIRHFEEKGFNELPMVEARYQDLLKAKGEEAAKAYLTDYTKDFIGATILRWDEMAAKYWNDYRFGF